MARTPWARALENSSTATAFPNTGAGPIATTTQPDTVDSSTPTGNLLIVNGGTEFMHLMPFGTDAADETFVVRIVGWREARMIGATSTTLWVPTHISDVTMTLGAKIGVAGASVINTDFFCDTAVAVANGDTNRVQLFSPTGDAYATIRVRLDGFQKIGVYFDLVTAASANTLYAFS